MSNDEISNKLNAPVTCVNLIKDEHTGNLYCKYLTNRTGKLFSANNKALCNFICSEKGPYNDKPITENEQREFVVESIKKLNEPKTEIIHEILQQYKLNFNIEIPKYYDEVKNSLEFLKNYQGFQKFTLTGPSITNNLESEYNNIDIVIWFDSLENYLNQKIEEILPKNINNKNINYYFYSEGENNCDSFFFSQMDVENKKIYLSKWFNMKISSIPSDFFIYPTTYQEYDMSFDEEIIKKDIIQPRLNYNYGWRDVVNSWHKASQFINAVGSRGMISTVLDYTGIDNTGGERVSDEIYNLRRESCFGNKEKNIPACNFLSKDSDDMFFCKGCGCGTNKLAVLNPTEENGYSKLHYPNLECPLRKPGFSNHIVQ